MIRSRVGLAAIVAAAIQTIPADAPRACASCESWNRPVAPFRVYGNTFYVGVEGLSAVLVTSPAGHVLIDGALPQSAPTIAANIASLGFALTDVKLILNSHAHFDHAGGIAALQRASGAIVAASVHGAIVLEAGAPGPDDPQFGLGAAATGFPRVVSVRRVGDGEPLRAGGVTVTAHLTPGHTPGSTTWTWQSCEGAQCLNVVYADSLNPVAADGFRFTGRTNGLSVVDTFRRSIAKMGALPCDILLTVHPSFADLAGKLQRRAASASGNPFVDPTACRSYAAQATVRLNNRLAEER